MPEKLKVAVAGVGRMGPIHALHVVELARETGNCSLAALVDLIVEETVTCYEGDRSHRHAWGYGCGDCPACQLRAKGFAKFMSRRTTT